MMKKIISLVILFSIFSFAQDTKKSNQNVELPDFVITGKENVSIQSAKKIPPDFISTVSPNFLKPVFSPEELEMKEISNPVKNDIALFDSINYISGIVEAGLGIYTLPKASLKFGVPFSSGIFDLFVNADNKRDYDNLASDWYKVGAGGNLTFFVNDNSSFIPGSKFKIHGDYKSTTFKNYAALQPLKRSLNQGSIGLNFENFANKYFNFAFSVYDNPNSLSDENFSENNLKITSFAKINLPGIFIDASLKYKSQNLKTDSIIKSHFTFFELTPKVGFDLVKTARASAGLTYSNSAGITTTVYPYASVNVNLTKQLTLFTEFAPRIEFLTAQDFFNQNRYFNPQTFLNVYYKKPFELNAVLKYEYDKYYQINGGAEYYTTENFPYFAASTAQGRFDVMTADGHTIRGYLDLLFHPGPNGVLYGSAEVNKSLDKDGNNIPYVPNLKLSLNYGYEFKFGFVVQPKLLYLSGAYTDIANTVSLNPYVDIGLKFIYKFNTNFHITFELNNLINNNNYLWQGYKEIPMDAIAGIVYQW